MLLPNVQQGTIFTPYVHPTISALYTFKYSHTRTSELQFSLSLYTTAVHIYTVTSHTANTLYGQNIDILVHFAHIINTFDPIDS